jgi:peptidoglycan/LPS O-acetylase OafA/YrhL
MTKRQDIQALRALAVTLVIAFHVWPAALPGGFVGVDVFFVISGYLISRQLLRELNDTGGISVSRFWARRIRRLLPAAFVTLLACLVVLLVVMPKPYWRDNLAGIVASAFYVQNWQLVASATEYLSAERDATIVQHFWSLAVEEQFYLFWPLLLVLLAALTPLSRRFRASTAPVAAILVASLAYSIYESQHGKALAYFSTFTRAWELAAGALILCLPTLGAESTQLRTAVAWIGFAAILIGAVTISSADPFPGYIAIIPVLGALLVIYAATDDSHSALARGFALRPVQWLGDVSYSAYLWHWPVVLAAPFLVADSLTTRASVLGMTLLLAGLSKRYVEDPFLHRDQWAARPPRFWYGFAATGMVVIVAITIPGWQRSVSQAKPVELAEYLEDPRAAIDHMLALDRWPIANEQPGDSAQAPEWKEDGCIDILDDLTANRCRYGPEDAEQTMTLIGDSWATHFLPALRSGFPAWRIQVLTLGQCPIAQVDVHKFGRLDVFEQCATHRQLVMERLAADPPDLIVAADSNYSTLARLMSGHVGEAAYYELESGYRRAYSELAVLPSSTMILESPPLANCRPDTHRSPRACTPHGLTWFERELTRMKLNLADEMGLAAVDTVEFFCNRDLVCPDQIGNTLMKADGAHIAGRFSKAWGPVLAQRILRSAQHERKSRPKMIVKNVSSAYRPTWSPSLLRHSVRVDHIVG